LNDAGVDINMHIFLTGYVSPEKSTQPLAIGSAGDDSNEALASTVEAKQTNRPEIESSFPRFINYQGGRPDVYNLLLASIMRATGESGVCVCGPIGLTTSIRAAVTMISDDRAVHKGTGAQGIYLHVANVDYS
jgi:hypothetical protein